MDKRVLIVERDPGKARKRAVGVALVGVMGAALAYEGAKLTSGDAGQPVEIFPDQAECGRRLDVTICARAFDLARSAHAAHATPENTEQACLAAWESCEAYGGRWRPTMVAVGVARGGRRLIARALARPRLAAPGDYATTGVAEAREPGSSGSSSSGSGGGGRWSSSSSGGSGSSSTDAGVSTHSGGGESVSAQGVPHGVAGHGVARGGFGAIGHGFAGHGG